MTEKTKFDSALFIIFSLAALAVFGLLRIFFAFGPGENVSFPAITDDKYFFEENRGAGDPLITDSPDLGEMLAGPIISTRDPGMGAEDATVTIVEFSDFQCGYCREQEKTIERLLAANPLSVRLIWKDFPEADEMSGSYQAALAARCAQTQGKFWPYHDLLFGSEDNLSRERYLKIAGLLALDMGSFTSCLDARATGDLVKDNMAEAQALDIVGVPFIFVNDREMMGEVSYEDLEKIVKSELEKTNKK